MFKKHKRLMITLTSVLSAILLFSVFVLVWFFCDNYKDYDELNETFLIEDLDSGIIPQGLGNSSDNKYFYITAYMNDGSASRIYVYKAVDSNKTDYDLVGYAELKKQDKDENGNYTTDFTGHAGGIASYGDKTWVASGNYVYVFDTSDLQGVAATNGEITYLDRFKVDNRASFCFYADNYLYVGEYAANGYATAESHKYNSNKAIYLAFKVNVNNTRGIESVMPEYAVSIPDKIQGIAVTSNYIALSKSSGMSKSHIYLYDKSQVMGVKATEITVQGGSTETNTKSIPLYYINDALVRDYVLPPMAEGLCEYNNNIYVMFENCSKKYRAISREKNEYVYKITPSTI